MLEIIVLFMLGKRIAQMCHDRGRKAWPWVLLMIFAWYGGAFTAAVMGMIAMAMMNPNAPPGDDDILVFAGFGIAGAIIGVSLTLLVVSLLPPVEIDEDADDEESEYRRRRQARFLRGTEKSEPRPVDHDGEEYRGGRYGGRGRSDDDDLIDRGYREDERDRYRFQ